MKKSEAAILEYLKKVCTEQKAQGRDDVTGCCAGDIAGGMGLQRTNVSAVLNQLYDAGKVIKIKGKPVLYAVDLNSGKQPQYHERNNFDMLIGGSHSLQKCIQRAKAAILYPPHGLHTLILGPTGVGKTMFAEMMYNFAVENGVYSPSAPFVSFNCADYANNPQLLLAHLFGCKKGTFTGADKDRPGIVERADGGVLFLDEVHRLPPEGQEMLFYLIDKGIYSPLGDVDNKKKSEVLIICATTEEIDSSLLITFTRRIPMNISLPALKDRTMEERFELVCEFFKIESRRVGKEIIVSTNTLRCLVLYHCSGNVGQLKSDIQLGCANAFLKCVSRGKKSIEVHNTDFANHVRQGLLLYKNRAELVDRLLKGDAKLCFKPNRAEEVVEPDDDSLPQNFYENIEKRIQELQEQGIDEQDIRFIMSFDIENYFKKFIHNFEQGVNKDELSKVVDNDIILIVENLLKFAGEKLRKLFPAKVFYGLCLHIQSSIERIKQGKKIINHNIKDIIEKQPEEYAVALHFAEMIEYKYDIRVPADEAGFIAMFLAVDETAAEILQRKPIIVVATHGKSTASSMVEVALKLAGSDNLFAYDMPLDKNPKVAYEEIKDILVKNHQGAGALLLVDMGALNLFGELISEETGIDIQVLDMVSTLIVIECARKAFTGSTVYEICEDIKNNQSLFANYAASITRTLVPEKDHIIISLCTTGEGSAMKIKTRLEDKLNLTDKNIQVVPMSVNNKKQFLAKINKLSKEKKIIALVGTFNPDIYDIPFIPVSALFEDENLQQLQGAVEKAELEDVYGQVFAAMKSELKEIDIEVYRQLFGDFIKAIQENLQITFKPEAVVGLIMHLACAINRTRQHGLCPPCFSKAELKQKYTYEFFCIKKSIKKIEDFYEIDFAEDEIWYIFRIIMSI
ncbi:phosphotransferase system mannose-type iia component [Lucifera butyrica]|uniref:Phosphotransferase system mannose-type iia component n=1 Tax=Lucifera butyrica TaxID=1351585 RepID=A0A498R348_9FIRM|nr:sigma-54-dependent transcriptional regulator [Lucifera butyrica]VBB07066.1 phosphotransferase system mannose-type iia component [Lucifera butyrica]